MSTSVQENQQLWLPECLLSASATHTLSVKIAKAVARIFVQEGFDIPSLPSLAFPFLSFPISSSPLPLHKSILMYLRLTKQLISWQNLSVVLIVRICCGMDSHCQHFPTFWRGFEPVNPPLEYGPEYSTRCELTGRGEGVSPPPLNFQPPFALHLQPQGSIKPPIPVAGHSNSQVVGCEDRLNSKWPILGRVGR